jgi:IS1 family transposase
LTRAGLHAEKLHAHFFQGLRFENIQLDELWANVRQESQEVWVWAAIEATTKIVPVIQVGPRTLEMAYAVVHELRERMQAGLPLPVFSSDGLRLYFYALTAHFGHWRVPEGGRKRVWHLAADFIGRLNLTLRQGVALLTRRTWGAAQQASELTLPVGW